MNRKSLDDILDGNDEPEIEAVEPQEAEQSEPEQQPRDESGKFAAKGVEPVEEPEAGPPPADKLPQSEYKALREEREKRQSLESQLEQLRREIQQQQEPPAPPPTLWEDENAWGGQLVSTAVQQAAYQSKLQMSEMLMAEQVEDFAEIKQQLVEFVGANPALNQQVAESQHPWRTAYQAFKNQQTMQELGATDLSSLEAKIREKIMAELQGQVPAKPNIPQSLSTKRNVGSRSGPAWAGPKSLDELLG